MSVMLFSAAINKILKIITEEQASGILETMVHKDDSDTWGWMIFFSCLYLMTQPVFQTI